MQEKEADLSFDFNGVTLRQGDFKFFTLVQLSSLQIYLISEYLHKPDERRSSPSEPMFLLFAFLALNNTPTQRVQL